MGLVELPWVDRVSQIEAVADRNQISFARFAPVSEREKRDLMFAGIEDAQCIPLELLAAFRPFHQPVAIVRFDSHPFPSGGIMGCKSSREIHVTIVAGKGDESIQLRTQAI